MEPVKTKPERSIRLTQYAHGGGCACKIPPWELEAIVDGLALGACVDRTADLLVGLDGGGDDAAVVRLSDTTAAVVTADFFTPVVDNAYDWGRIAAANALSDVYAMGGTPVVALNIVGWPRDVLPTELLVEVLRGGADIAREASCLLAGGHSIDDPEPKYGLAVTGVIDPSRMMLIGAGKPGLPLSLTKPLGIGVLNTKHKATGEWFPQAIEAMTMLNRAAAAAALAAGVACATDITGFGLLGHGFKLARASGLTARIDLSAVPYLDGAREAAAAGFVSGGTQRNLAWVESQIEWKGVSDLDRLLLADAQTSGGLLIAGEIPGASVIGELTKRGDTDLVIG